MCRRNSGQSRRKRRICSRILVCSPALRSTTIEEGTVIPPTTRDKLALSGVADRNCRCHSLLQCVRPITWFDLGSRIESILQRGIKIAPAAIALGADSPLLSARDLKQAVQELASGNAVLGPCEDGGFYLLG